MNDPNMNQKDLDFEAFYADILNEFGDQSTSEEDFLKELLNEPPQKAPQPAAVDRHTYADRQQQKKEAPVKKEKGLRGLIFLIIVELLGLAGVAAWWAMRLL